MDWLSPSLPFLAALNRIHAWVAPAKAFSFLGNEEFFLLLVPIIYWAVSRRIGAQLGVLLLFSASINEIFKVGLALPRPFWLLPSLKVINESGFGFPSGHAQNAAVVWTYLAAQTRNRKLWLPLALLLIAAIGFSRLVLGVHFPVDVIGGALIGFVILGLASRSESGWMTFWHEIQTWQKIAVSLLILVILIGTYGGAMFHGSVNYLSDAGQPSLPALQDAMNGTGISSRLGGLFGLLVGLALAGNMDFEADGPLTMRAARLAVGFVGLALFYFGLKRVFPDLLIFRFARYALTTWWVSCGALWVFGKLGLAGRSSRLVPGG